MTTLHIRQQLICCFIDSYTRTVGFPPTVREMTRWTGASCNYVVQYHLLQLEHAGYVHGGRGSRCYRLTESGKAIAARWKLAVVA